MNNNYYNYNPNSLFRAVPMANVGMPMTRASVMPMAGAATPLPRISSLLAGSSAPRAGAAAASAVSGASKLSFSSLLNGASKTLGVINQAIPVVYQVKPIWNNARTMFRVAKEISSSGSFNNNTTNSTPTNIEASNQDKSTQTKESDNSPTFFI